MRKRIVAGNWKMNTTVNEGIELAEQVAKLSETKPGNVDLVIAPPFTHLTAVVNKVKGSGVNVGSQNCAAWSKGAYTGEISVDMIASTGASYIIIGHSERREYFKESNETLYVKVKLTLDKGLTPIFCCGEVLSERDAEQHFEVVQSQVSEVLFKLSENEMSQVVIAYEPVWAIGTGRTASPEQAQEMHAHIRSIIEQHFGQNIAQSTSILYGGSCKPDNAVELFANPDVDGGLIGGAALKASDFIAIANSFPK